MSLTDFAIRTLRPELRPVKSADGGGLHILVQPNGKKYWRLSYRFAGRQKSISGGAYPIVTLADARKWRNECKALLINGIDPSHYRQQDRAQVRQASQNTFQCRAGIWLDTRQTTWSATHKGVVERRLALHVYPLIGNIPVAEIGAREAIDMLRKIESKNVGETTYRVKRYCSSIMRLAVADDLIEIDPFRDVAEALKRAPRVKHLSRLQVSQLPTYFAKLAQSKLDDLTVIGLELTMLTMVRTNETRFARWCEFEALNTSEPLWRIPGERMKTGNDHLVPLSRQVLPLLDKLRVVNPSNDFIFEFPTRSGVISENRMLFGLYKLGYRNQATVHGFRGLASTVLNEGNFNSDWIERQLAHVDINKVRSAYNAAQWISGRRDMLQWWADFLDQQREIGNLIG